MKNKATIGIIIGLICLAVIGGGGFYLWNNNTAESEYDVPEIESTLDVEYSTQEMLFYELSMVDTSYLSEEEQESIATLMAEGNALLRDFSAINDEKVSKITAINEQLALKVEEAYTKQFEALSTKLTDLEAVDVTTIKAENQERFTELLQTGKALVINRSVINESKVQQLESIIMELEDLQYEFDIEEPATDE